MAIAALLRWLPAAACLLLPAVAAAVEESELKAAIVFNLLLFVDWPAEVLPGGSPLVLCIGPQSSLKPALKNLAGRDLRGHRLEVRELPPAPPRSCRAVYLEATDRLHVATLLAPMVAAGTLVVSDDAEAPKEHTAILLQRAGNKFVFDVHLQALRPAQLQLSSKLLRLARLVTE